MSRRNTEMFNLSFLDLLSGALGAVIFLFIITPKGGNSPSVRPQVIVAIDSAHHQLFGSLHDSLFTKKIGDTLLVVIKEFKKMPTIEDCPECPPPVQCPECPKCPEKYIVERYVNNTNTTTKPTETKPVVLEEKPVQSVKVNQPVAASKIPEVKQNEDGYKGDPPSVPCKVSFEIAWEDIGDNVDFFVCRGGDCVYGGKRKNKQIGYWDSGKSKTSLFGSDLRTTMEAVRQFDEVIPGEYELYAHFKNSKNGNTSTTIKGLVYTRGDSGKQQGERFSKSISLQKSERTLIGKVVLAADGTFTFSK